MSKEKWGFVINPIAGNGYARQYAAKVKEKISQHNLDARLVFTERRGHAVELAAALAREGCTIIVAVGGDGTANETARGLLDQPQVTFGIVSAGTGNDFAPVLGFSEHFTDEDWDVLFEEHTTRMDIGKCNENYFLNGMGLGFDAQVAAENYRPDQSVKEGSGTKYFRHIIKNLFLYREKPLRAQFNGHKHEALTFMNTIGNGRRVGGGYYLTPQAYADDGLFDICLVEPLPLLERLKLFLKAPKGGHLSHPKVSYFRAPELYVEFDETVPHHLDGELFFAEKFHVRILPKKLKVLFNPRGRHFLQLA